MQIRTRCSRLITMIPSHHYSKRLPCNNDNYHAAISHNLEFKFDLNAKCESTFQWLKLTELSIEVKFIDQLIKVKFIDQS